MAGVDNPGAQRDAARRRCRCSAQEGIFVAEAIDPEAVLWSAHETARYGGNLLVLLHGATSSERDLFSRLVPLLPRNLTVASVRGPISEGSGYSWVSPETRRSAATDSAVTAVGNEAARSVLAWLDRLPTFGSVGLLGASQGACIAFQLLRTAPSRFAYAINLSGYSLPGTEEGDSELRRTRPPVFWGRGRYDTVIPQDYVERTMKWLLQHSTLTARTYEMGHTDSVAKLADVAAFVAANVNDREDLPRNESRVHG
ncbi:MAG: phospholipase [Propionibacteriaceae bacterium]|nr:phospholipase [Propionibacteriaceae bacterium]